MKTANKDNPNTRRLVMRQHAGQHMERAERLERAGRWEEAMAEFKSAVELDPSMADAQLALGYHYRRKGLLLKAADAFRAAARMSDDFESVYNLGLVLTDLKRYAEAEAAFAHSLRARPGDPGVRYELAYARFGLGRYAEALELLNKLLEEYPEDWELLILRGQCQLRQKAYAEAQADFRRALEGVLDADARGLILDGLDAATRYQEFAPEAELSAKDRFYLDYGVVYLGSAQDDGLAIPKYLRYALDYADVALTLWRLVEVCEGLSVWPSVVLPAAPAALPLAIVLSEMLRLPIVALERVRAEDWPLLVMGVCSGPELYDVILERLPSDPVGFALGVDWTGRTEFMPDIVGVFTEEPARLPWEPERDWERWPHHRGGLSAFLEDTRAGRAVLAHATRLLRAAQRQLPEPQRAAQVAYYTTLHHTLRPSLTPEHSP